jgi:uncharacterized membrane protein
MVRASPFRSRLVLTALAGLLSGALSASAIAASERTQPTWYKCYGSSQCVFGNEVECHVWCDDTGCRCSAFSL